MPTNVPPEYKKAEEAFRQAKRIDEKIERLQDMIAHLPKHKGTDHLYADLKRRLARLRREMESTGKKTGGGGELQIKREGAAQVVLLGPPNSGKSSILVSLTNARVEAADYPFTTTQPFPGMIEYEDIQIQLVDTPPVTHDYFHAHILGLVRSADAVLIVADASSDTLLEDLEALFKAFSERHVEFVPHREDTDRDHVLTRVIANKMDAGDAQTRLELIKEYLQNRLDIIPITCTDKSSLGKLPEMLFRWLGIVRVYTKAPGQKPNMERPYTLFKGQTVLDLCAQIHRDFVENLKSARLWREDNPPITVSRFEPVQDKDILELHI